MNWLSKFVNFFLTDNEDEFDEAEQKQEVEKQKQTTEVNHTANNNNVETRISYQYPQGNFRFPVIPDRVPNEREEPKKARQVRQPRQSNVQRFQQVKQAETSLKVERNSRRHDKNEPRSVYKEKRPFHPTEIPSPIYGFRSRELASEEEVLKKVQYRYKEEIDIVSPKIQSNEEKFQIVMDDILILEPIDNEIKETDQRINEKNDTKSEIESETELLILEKEPLLAEEVMQENEQLTKEKYKEEDRSKPHMLQMAEEIDEKNDTKSEIGSEAELLILEKEPLLLEEVMQGSEQLIKEEYKEEDRPKPLILKVSEEINGQEESGELGTAVSRLIENQKYNHRSNESVQSSSKSLLELHEDKDNTEHIQQEKIEYESKDIISEDQTVQRSEDRIEQMRTDEPAKEIPSSDEKSNVPFNVVMLNRDKKKLSQNQEGGYQFPSLTFLNIPPYQENDDQVWLEEQKELLDVTLKNFNVGAKVVNVTQGPAVTRFEVHPEPGVKVNKITNLTDDIKLSLSAKDIRIEAPIPGKNTIGIEVPNKESKMVFLREILRNPVFRSNPSAMTAVLGLDISGQPVVTDLSKMPHGLIAGATGSGKSVCINTILVSLLYKAAPHEVKLLLIDPKMVELAPYNEIPHLVSPVITDVKAATGALKWAVEEMERRYELFAHSGVRDIKRYNDLVKEHEMGDHLPYIVIIIDELADLMMVAPGDVEEAICRIAQKARACGIHLIVATQRPSVDVITGLIKANIPTRIAFSVSSQIDSRTIIDVNGAEKLLGKGDMLFLENGSSKAVRLQGTFVSDEEIERVVAFVKKQSKPNYLFEQEELMKRAAIQADGDELFYEACEFVVAHGSASTSSVQRRFRIGYNRAARLIDLMEEQGIISGNRGSKPRDVLITEEDLEMIQEGNSF
ncbi:DNA translocase FtsK [Metabacillus fastidiosus]|uniref:DNA translocase FtsK n=1 Tax=Metabacillus fastidiosus TaxID=1458 RepID=UPI002DB99951|nr:DNA translocase FtsK [Metabacillus fastidiosus]MEC2078248.1 DNA translocase FtsK [Metabacillus fastidiosus]